VNIVIYALTSWVVRKSERRQAPFWLPDFSDFLTKWKLWMKN
jgi:hypothetical protein